jgi:O-antigen ligase
VITLALSAAGIALAFFRPAAAASALVFLVPLAPGLARLAGDSAGAPVLTALALAVFGGALSGALARGERSVLPPRLLSSALPFLALAAGSAVASIARGETLALLLHGRIDPLPVNALGMTAAERSRDAVLTFLGLALLLLGLEVFSRLSRAAGSRSALLLAASAGAAAAFVAAAVGRFLPLDPSFQPWSDLQRRAGTFTDPNSLGLAVGLLVPLLLAALARRETPSDGVRRVLALVALAAAPIALESSGSRTGFLLATLALGLGAIGLLRAGRISGRKLALALVVAAAFGAGIAPFLPRGGGIAAGGLLQRLGAGLSSSSLEDVADNRTMFWRTALEMTADEPLSGVGLAAFPYEFPAAYARHHEPIFVTDGATNAVLEVAAECGLPGLVLALLAVIPIFSRAWKEALSRAPIDLTARASGAALFGLAVACQTGSHLRFPEIAILTSLLAGLLFLAPSPDEAPAVAAEPFPAGWAHLPGILAAAGIVGAFVAVLPTARPSAPFRVGRWIGLYGPDPTPRPFRWSGPRACRIILPGETEEAFRVQNARPDGLPMTLVVDVDGRRATSLPIPGGSSREMTVPVARGAGMLCVTGSPTFVPHELTGVADFRRLSFRLAPGDVP